jgi:hypothetical protein
MEFPVQFACKNAIIYIGSPENVFIVVVKQEGVLYSLCTQSGENMRIIINRSFNRQTLIKVLGCPRDLSQETLSLGGIAVFSTYQSRRYHCVQRIARVEKNVRRECSLNGINASTLH